MASTTRQLITGALRLIGVVQAGESPSEDDMDISLQSFSQLIDSWSNDRLMVYTINPYTVPVTAGQKIYTLGSGGDWDIERPLAIEQATVELNSGQQTLSIQMRIVNDAQYAAIAVKETPSNFGWTLFDNGNYPLRSIYLWPIPTVDGSIDLWLRQPLVNFTDLDTVVEYPPGYERAFRFNLAVELAPEFAKILPPDVGSIAAVSKKEIALINAPEQYMTTDGGLLPNHQRYNWITGGFFPLRS